jgi:hypothetical protein
MQTLRNTSIVEVLIVLLVLAVAAAVSEPTPAF